MWPFQHANNMYIIEEYPPAPLSSWSSESSVHFPGSTVQSEATSFPVLGAIVTGRVNLTPWTEEKWKGGKSGIGARNREGKISILSRL